MSKAKTKSSMTSVLRGAIAKSGLPLLQLAQATGIDRASLSRFASGKRSLRLNVADKLAEHFELTLVKRYAK
jgi:transcriptional regulator with XRE-family HTH domain